MTTETTRKYIPPTVRPDPPMERTTPNVTEHRHDLGISISVGDLDPMQLVVLRSILTKEVADLVERVNGDTAALTGQTIGWSVSYDGNRECGEHSWQR